MIAPNTSNADTQEPSSRWVEEPIVYPLPGPPIETIAFSIRTPLIEARRGEASRARSAHLGESNWNSQNVCGKLPPPGLQRVSVGGKGLPSLKALRILAATNRNARYTHAEV